MDDKAYSNHISIRALRSVAFLLFLNSCGQLFVAFVSLSETNNIFSGGIWSGILGLLLCIGILRKHVTLEAFQYLCFACFLTFLSACISTGIISGNISDVNSIITCTSCVTGSCDFYGSKVFCKNQAIL